MAAGAFAVVVATLRAAGCVFAEDEALLLAQAAASPRELAELVSQRAAGHPLEHVVGWAEFCGLRVSVTAGVFVPRPRTELLVREAVRRCPPGAIVTDLACGSGAIALAVATLASVSELHAADVDPAATACARRNLAVVGGQVHEGDLYQPLPGRLHGQISLLTANVPYVPSAAIAFLPPEARVHEPLTALDGGADGLAVLRKVAAGASDWLAPGGHLLIEVSAEQAAAALAEFAAAGLGASQVSDDELGATVVIGTRPAPAGAGR